MLPKPLQNLITELSKLPGIGPKAAEKLAFWLLEEPTAEVEKLAQAIRDLKLKTRPCAICFNIAENNLCSFCSDTRRDKNIICVVETPSDIIPIEKTGQFKGLYHVLGGVLAPVEGITVDKLHINQLIKRVKKDNIGEIIIATNPTIEGDATALYLTKILRSPKVLPFAKKIKITRLGRGLPTGADLEYADEITLSDALSGRREM